MIMNKEQLDHYTEVTEHNAKKHMFTMMRQQCKHHIGTTVACGKQHYDTCTYDECPYTKE